MIFLIVLLSCFISISCNAMQSDEDEIKNICRQAQQKVRELANKKPLTVEQVGDLGICIEALYACTARKTMILRLSPLNEEQKKELARNDRGFIELIKNEPMLSPKLDK